MKICFNLLIVVLLSLSQGVNSQWAYVGIPTSRSVQAFAFKDSTVVVGTNQGINYSSNYGNSWMIGGGGIAYADCRAVVFAPIFTNYYQVNWLAGYNVSYMFGSLIPASGWSIFPRDSAVLTGGNNVNSILKTTGDELYVGTDKGMYILKGGPPNEYWDRINNGLYSGDFTIVREVIEFNGDVFIGTNSGVYKRTSSGWIEKNVGLTNTNVTALGGSGSFLFAGTNTSSTEGVFISSDHGESWTFAQTIPWVTSIQAIGPNIFASSYGDGIWLSIDYGSSWTQINDGFSSSAYYVLSTGINDKYIYAGTNASGVWRRDLSELVTDVNHSTNLTPSAFYLGQNYPNPFNPSTTISFSIPNESFVSLKVFNSLGEEVAELVRETKPAGNYSVSFDASELTSGIYFYKITAGSFSQTRKMILVK
jgi:hypothetical protein